VFNGRWTTSNAGDLFFFDLATNRKSLATCKMKEPMSNPPEKISPLAYENPDFLNSP